MLIANVWYIADWSESVTDRSVKVKMLGWEILLFRGLDGKAVFLSNTRCQPPRAPRPLTTWA